MAAVHGSVWLSGRLFACVAALAAISVAGCDDEEVFIDDDDGEDIEVVDVAEREFEILLDEEAGAEGLTTFVVSNVGNEMHEFLVIRTDLAPNALPINADGSYFENGPGTELVDEIEDIMPGEIVELTLDLPAGNYVLICNMVEVEDNGEVESHYAEGMYAGYQVVSNPNQL